MLCFFNDFIKLLLIFNGVDNNVTLGFWLYSIILFPISNISFKVSNLSLASSFLINETNGLPNIIEKIVPW